MSRSKLCRKSIDELDSEDPIRAYAASADPDTMYYHEAMKAPGKKTQFMAAMQQEVQLHTKNGGVWAIVPAKSVPDGFKISPAVWAMKRKRKIAAREVYNGKPDSISTAPNKNMG